MTKLALNAVPRENRLRMTFHLLEVQWKVSHASLEQENVSSYLPLVMIKFCENKEL